jgi:DNA-binding Lrp family transcriptional regulator
VNLSAHTSLLDEVDRRIVLATQAGLPLVPRPYEFIGESIGVSSRDVMRRLGRMTDLGIIRRIGVVPNHYAIGYHANALTVWDVDDAQVDVLGERIGALQFVSHCYLRERVLPDWPYNLFVMVHAADRRAVEGKVARVAGVVGTAARAHEILYSTRVLKKTGMRLDATGAVRPVECPEQGQ